MHSGKAPHQRAVFDDDVPSQGGHRDDDPAAHCDIVADVAASENVVVRADQRLLSVAGRAVDGHTFANGIVIADNSAGQTAFPLQVLGL